MPKKIVQIVVWILTFQVVSYLLGLITRANMNPWYNELDKSILTPPPIIFPIAWFILYIMLALSGWFLWERRKEPLAEKALIFYFTQLAMNWAWTPLFFYFHLIGLSFLWIVVMVILTLITLYLTKNKFTFSAIMLLPYVIWLGFAAYLNGFIWIMNI
jgi:benzodiazapine receptor